MPRSPWILLLLLVSFLAPCLARSEEPLSTYPLLPSDYSSIKVYDRQGRYVGRLLAEERYWVPLERIPSFLQNAVIAVEDARFYEHGGFDMRGIARALVKDVIKRQLAEGGSTITQQLVKNRHLSGEKTLDRKVKEGLLALEYEKKYSKAQILEMYLNEIYFGHGAWGIAQAARLYFDKAPQELSEVECAVLAGVPKNPGRYNPLGKPEEVERRKRIVLARMAELEMIAPQRQEQLRAARHQAVPPNQAPQYLAQVRRKLVGWAGAQILEQGGVEITAALDLKLQLLAERVLREGVGALGAELQGALLSLDPRTGDIVAMAGAVDYGQSNYNRALFARRQPGSAIKPLIYAAALERGVTAVSRWDDTPVAYPRGGGRRWTPLNYGGERFGSLTLREALAHSGNVVTVKLLDAVGVPLFRDFAAALELPLPVPGDLSLALGTHEATLHDLALSYLPLANAGLRTDARTITCIYNRRLNVWIDLPPAPTQAMSPGAAFITTRMLQDVLSYGTARALAKFVAERPAAGKTGTTDDGRDAWFVGYTPQLLTAVWVGHDQPRPGGKGFTGGAIAAPLWERFMRPALAAEPLADFVQPATVVALAIDPAAGCRADPLDPAARLEYFFAGTEPTAFCPGVAIVPAVAEDPPEVVPETAPEAAAQGEAERGISVDSN